MKFSTNVSQDYLRDESRRIGKAEAICFPTSEQETIEALAYARDHQLKVTVQGSRTGITAGAVPSSGLIINLSKMNRITGLRKDQDAGSFYITVQPGVILADLKKALASKQFDTTGWSSESLHALEDLRTANPWTFTADPTETTASIGGMVACNASGARSYHFGPVRPYVSALRVALAGGDLLVLRRGTYYATEYNFKLTTELTGRTISGTLPQYSQPKIKSAAGYYINKNMDMIDLFIGSEGTLGIATSIELQLQPSAGATWDLVAFFPNEASAIKFVHGLRGDSQEGPSVAKPTAIEFFDHHTLDLLRQHQANLGSTAIWPTIAPQFHSAIYVEYQGDTEDILSEAVTSLIALLEECGGSEANTWIATEEKEREKLLAFRHAVPEAVNSLIDERRKTTPELTKLGTDMAVPDNRLGDVLLLYHQTLDTSGLEYVMFGHIGDNHIHVNILPKTTADYNRGKEIYFQWADAVVKMGGTISAEHGIGKLKTAMLRRMYGDKTVAEMKALRAIFDPGCLVNPGNLFD